ncbi:MAG TPA: hypothetical protein VJR89_21860 [Polyangiales bacterium]|nr:hypothetical protein [Polyangiales bacterium]
MSKRAHLSFGLVVPLVSLLSLIGVGCGDDDGGDGTTAGKGGSGGSSGDSAGSGDGAKAGSSGGAAGSAAGAGGAATGMGNRPEGAGCMSTAQCSPGLTCTVQAVGEIGVRVCARPCTASDQCGSELCASPFTERPQDAICINTEPAPFAYCGPGATAVCGGPPGRRCLFFTDSTVGVCVDLCQLDPTKDAGLAEEMIPEKCAIAGQTCISGIVDDNGANVVGLCGVEVDRGAECGLEMGKLCKGTDICLPDNFMDDESPQHCREDCGTTGKCTGPGTCMTFQDISYCK